LLLLTPLSAAAAAALEATSGKSDGIAPTLLFLLLSLSALTAIWVRINVIGERAEDDDDDDVDSPPSVVSTPEAESGAAVCTAIVKDGVADAELTPRPLVDSDAVAAAGAEVAEAFEEEGATGGGAEVVTDEEAEVEEEEVAAAGAEEVAPPAIVAAANASQNPATHGSTTLSSPTASSAYPVAWNGTAPSSPNRLAKALEAPQNLS
jgi:hypothetical protein